MGKVIRCQECGMRYKGADRIEELQDNDGVCLQCDAPIEVEDWDRILASYEDDDIDDVDDEDDDDFDDDELEDEDDEERAFGWGDDDPDDDVDTFDDDADDDDEDDFDDDED